MSARGLLVYVHRSPAIGDCTNDGISATHDRLTVVGYIDETEPGFNHFKPVVRPMPASAQVFEASDDAPAVLLHIRNVGGPIPSFVPATLDGQRVEGWHMMGGNFGHVGDSRFNTLVRALLGHDFYGAIAIHDRNEER